MRDYSMDDLVYWDERIREIADHFKLDYFPQEFELCDYNDMLNYSTYIGMPSHYPHWSFGKAYEKTKTLYNLGLTGLAYEMVINSNPALAYLMKDNSLSLQILTMAHVYAHNDFFKNNHTFSKTHPETVIDMFNNHAKRIRNYIKDPSIGIELVENVLDAAHGLKYQCQRNLDIKSKTRDEQIASIYKDEKKKSNRATILDERKEYDPQNVTKIPLEPEENILQFMIDYNPYLEEWQKDILSIVVKENEYFLPQAQTKIMNEGWASYWHYNILKALDLPKEMYMEFLVNHNQVVRPIRGMLNPYYLGYKMFFDIRKKWDYPTEEEKSTYSRNGSTGFEKIFQVRVADRDESFIRQYLTLDLMEELDIFVHKQEGYRRVISDISDKDGWKNVRSSLIQNIGLNSIPIIKIVDANWNHRQELYLVHQHDGRDLDLRYAEETLKYIQRLWQKPVTLETLFNGTKKTICCTSQDENIIYN